MDCARCQENISPFIDGELDEASSAAIREHLIACEGCAGLFEEFAGILENCRGIDADSAAPPNSRAMWCRINNILETDVKKEEETPELPSQGWFGRRLHMSFSQVSSLVLGIALISSLLTVVAIRNYMQPSADEYSLRSTASQTTFEKFLSRIGLSETPQEALDRRIREQQVVIDYWDKRVRDRRSQWDERMQVAFDRNLVEIDQAVKDYTSMLEKDPEDEVTVEMLDSALNDKMNLLRQFSEL